MTDSVAVLSLADRITDANGVPVPGAILSFFQAGTTTPLPVYSDAALSVPLGSDVYCDSGGFPVTQENGSTRTLIYTGTAAYKVAVTDADDGAVWPTLDNIKGAIDTSSFSGGGVQQQIPVVAKSSSFTVSASTDNGILFDVNCTGGDAVVTFPSAITALDGFYFGIRHNGTANEVINETVSSQSIRHFGAATDALALTARGETVWFVSDGANWVAYSYTPALINNTPGIITITDRLSAPPVTPVAGARYLLTSSPSGAWSSFAQHDVVESDGSGSWIRRTPPTDCGWLAYVQDEDRLYLRVSTYWLELSLVAASAGEMAAAASDKLVSTPLSQHYHPGHPKAWGKANNSSSLQAGYGFSGVIDNGTGEVIWTLSVPFTSVNYGAVASSLGGARFTSIATQATGSITTVTYNDLGAVADAANGTCIAAFGAV